MKKSIIAILLLLAFVTTSVHALASNDYTIPTTTTEADETTAPKLTLITTITPTLRVSGTTASYSLYVTCISSVNSIKATLQIQQLNGGKWVDYGLPWYASATTSYLTTSGTKTVASGYTYRLKVDITASNGTATGMATEYS